MGRCLLVYDIIGGKQIVTPFLLRGILFHPYTVLFVMLIEALLLALNLHGFRPHFTIFAAFLLISFMVALLTSIYAGILLICMVFSRKFPKFFVYLPIVGMISMTLTSAIVAVIVDFLAGAPYLVASLLHDLPTNLTISLVIEAIFLVFVVPNIVTRVAAVHEVDKKHATAIQLGGKTFDVSQIVRMVSQDHYVEVTMPNGKALVRARLRNAIAQLPIRLV